MYNVTYVDSKVVSTKSNCVPPAPLYDNNGHYSTEALEMGRRIYIHILSNVYLSLILSISLVIKKKYKSFISISAHSLNTPEYQKKMLSLSRKKRT